MSQEYRGTRQPTQEMLEALEQYVETQERIQEMVETRMEMVKDTVYFPINKEEEITGRQPNTLQVNAMARASNFDHSGTMSRIIFLSASNFDYSGSMSRITLGDFDGDQHQTLGDFDGDQHQNLGDFDGDQHQVLPREKL